MFHRIAIALITAATVLAPNTRVDAQAPSLATDALVESVVRAWNVPGVGVAIVQDGRVVMARGFGVRQLGATDAVSEHTPFYLASATKPFTIAALAQLADAGTLRIDDPVTKYLPTFALGDETSRQLTVRDLMAHRTGYPRADLLTFSGLDDAGILARMSGLKPSAPIRSRFTYSNQMYLALSQIVSRISARPFADVLQTRLLDPLGMRDSTAGGLGPLPDGARPHAMLDGTVRPVDFVARAPYGGGAINSSAADLAKWLQLLLGDGTAGGTRIVSAAALSATMQPNTIVQPTVWTPDATFMLYGLGWFLSDYHGHRVVQHGGNGEGWTSLVWMLPDDHLGIAVVTNMHNTLLPWAIAHRVADSTLGRPARDWTKHFLDAERNRDAAATRAVPASTPGPLSTADWAGTWTHAVYGEVTISGDGAFELRYGPALRGTLSPAQGGALVTWRRSDIKAVLGSSAVRLIDRAGSRVMQLVLGGDTIEFTRTP